MLAALLQAPADIIFGLDVHMLIGLWLGRGVSNQAWLRLPIPVLPNRQSSHSFILWISFCLSDL
jgi:hypothetical protein